MTAEVWISAFQDLLRFDVMFYLFIGILLGTVIGALPGLSATMGVAIITPITFWLDKTVGLAMIMGLWNAAVFAGGITAILINTPGTPASITQAFDGYPLAKQGKGGLALGINVLYSFLGGMVSIILLILFAQPIAKFTISFTSPEYFMIALFGLSMMVAVSGDNILKGMILGVFGILLSTIGIDPISGARRMTFNYTNLNAGIDFIPVMIGLFGLAEILHQIYAHNQENALKEKALRSENLKLGRILPSFKQMKELTPRCLLVSFVATIIGAIPAAGGDISAIICWGNSKKFSKKSEEYGHGSVEGLAVSSTANNGVIGGAMCTMLTLGLPGDSVTAILLGSLMMYGLTPGYTMFTENAGFTSQIFILMIFANIGFLILGLATAKASAKVLNVNQQTVWACVSILCIVGTFCINNRFSDVIIMAAMGLLGLFFKIYDFPTGPLVLGLLLGSTMEKSMRRALVVSHGDFFYFFQRPISCVLFVVVILTLFAPIILKIKRKKLPLSN